MPKTSSSLNYYPFLDGLRAIAILWVGIHHALPMISSPTSIPAFKQFAEVGFLGVDIFFVISGFLITGLLVNDLNANIGIKRFYIRRFYKIVPHYLTVVLTIFALFPLISTAPRQGPLTFASYFVFLQNYVPPVPLLSHLWSVAIEEHFYFIYALFLLIVYKLSPNIQERRRFIIVFLFIFIILGHAIRYSLFQKFPPPYTPPILFQQTHMRFDALIAGCLLRFLELPLKQFKTHLSNQLRNISTIIAVSIFVYLYFQYDRYHWIFYGLTYLAAGFLIMGGLFQEPLLLKICEHPLLRWIGKNSYGIYLWHYPVSQAKVIFKSIALQIMDLVPSLKILPLDFESIFSVGLYALISIYLGNLTTRLIENYFLNIRNKVMP